MAEHRIVLTTLDAPPTHSAPYCAGPKQREVEHKEVAQMERAGVAEPAVVE